VSSPTIHNPHSDASESVGLRYWMLRVLEECDNLAAEFSPDPVHDLRVSLRRCRSLADGLIALDSDPDWKAMKKAGRSLFQRLGALRDIHVMEEWIEKLDPARNAAKGVTDGAFGEGASEANSIADADAGSHSAAADPAQVLREILRHRVE
jgi:CHAD domain-containing protein